jgi:acetyltransferase-like isoleucine patch superfamily enzyme
MPETTIGKGSIVAAYSYVKGSFPDFAIISGNPAKVVGDTRELDKKYLDENPELNEYYNRWTK